MAKKLNNSNELETENNEFESPDDFGNFEDDFHSMPLPHGGEEEEVHDHNEGDAFSDIEHEENNQYDNHHENNEYDHNNEEHELHVSDEDRPAKSSRFSKFNSGSNKTLFSKLILPVGAIAILVFVGLVVVKPMLMNHTAMSSTMTVPNSTYVKPTMVKNKKIVPMNDSEKVVINNSVVPTPAIPEPMNEQNMIKPIPSPSMQPMASTKTENTDEVNQVLSKVSDEIDTLQSNVNQLNTNVSDMKSSSQQNLDLLNNKVDELQKQVTQLETNQSNKDMTSQEDKIDSALIAEIARKDGINPEDVQSKIIISGFHLVGVSAEAADVMDNSNNSIILVKLGEKAPGGGIAEKITKDAISGWELITSSGTIKE
jgi:cell division protein FtsB